MAEGVAAWVAGRSWSEGARRGDMPTCVFVPAMHGHSQLVTILTQRLPGFRLSLTLHSSFHTYILHYPCQTRMSLLAQR